MEAASVPQKRRIRCRKKHESCCSRVREKVGSPQGQGSPEGHGVAEAVGEPFKGQLNGCPVSRLMLAMAEGVAEGDPATFYGGRRSTPVYKQRMLP